MSDRQEPPYTAQSKYRVTKPHSNYDAASLLSSFQGERGQFQSFTRRQAAAAVPEVPVGQPRAASLIELRPPAPAEPTSAMGIEVKPVACTNVAVFSPAGGSGKSTMIAALGSILCQQGKRVLLLDTCPWQSIAFHFGASEAKTGRRTFFAPGSKEASLTLLPFGDDDESLSSLREVTVSAPFDYVLYDLSGASGKAFLQLLRKCEIALVPLLPDFSALRSVATVKKLLEPLGESAPKVRFVLNCMDDSTTAREVLEILNGALGYQLFPSVILQQPEVRKALAEGIVLPSFAPEAQATLVFEEIAHWLLKPDNAASVARKWSEG
jgi:chromosome partitioning protein